MRNATPKGAAGRVYGFVYSGLDLGAMLGPVWFGLMLDHGLGREMFYVVAVLLALAVGTVVRVRRAIVAAALAEESCMDLGIAGRRALVCAASKGLGRGCAEALAREGVEVTIVARTEATLAQTAREIGAAALGGVRHHDTPRAARRRSPRVPTPTSSSPTPAARRPATSATATATRGSARSTPTC